MKRPAPLIMLVLAAVVGLALWLSLGSRAGGRPALSGYLEGDVLYMAAPVSGAVKAVFVVEGQRVGAGAPLFAMDPKSLLAQRDQAAAQVAQALAQISVAKANLDQMKANLAGLTAQASNAAKTFARDLALRKANPGAISPQTIDNDQAAASNTAAQHSAAEKQVNATAAQVSAAQGGAAQARAARANIDIQLAQLNATAPAGGRVQTVFYQTGEWAAANQPVVGLLPDDKVKLRFFVPEGALALYQLGRIVHFKCDACSAGLTAQISYVSPQPEYTPPIIYSQDSRDKLVFLVEALPKEPQTLTPGQPVDVVPLQPARTADK
ncbi:MAG TPA: HlyD family efflux transporter periplasmic adaptor subunit [Beijerinckiaceae bacterium]|nr:HlyD family efflux transporter periplasmic adaptor subunit [Beijerinckiaceae bacterium]